MPKKTSTKLTWAKHVKSFEFDENDVGDGELIGSRKSDTVDLSGYLAPLPTEGVTVFVGNGNDQVTGSEADDFIWGGNGKDFVEGSGGNDEVYGENGKDELFGDAGDNSLWGGNGKDELFGGEGNDSLSGGNGKDYLDAGAGDDQLFGDRGKDALFGGEGNDSLLGGGGKDYLEAGAGDDQLFGESGKDELDGGSGNDTLDGGEGKDNLVGGEDSGTFGATVEVGGLATIVYELGDDLTGGGGRDQFIYKSGDGVDIIRDFNRGEGDRIKLLDMDADDVAILQDGGNSIIVFLDGATPDANDLIADAAIVVEGVDDISAEDILFA